LFPHGLSIENFLMDSSHIKAGVYHF